jgi:hypothetical protein
MQRGKKMKIAPKFYHADFENPRAYTVGELKEILVELPDDLAIKQGFEYGVALVIYNDDNMYGDSHLEFEEIEEEDY